MEGKVEHVNGYVPRSKREMQDEEWICRERWYLLAMKLKSIRGFRSLT
jgi:hypothetical protein